MPALQVRDFPQDLYEGLKESAALEHRSLAQQTVYAVEEMLARRANRNTEEKPKVISFDSIRERQERIAKRKSLFSRIEQCANRLPNELPKPEDVIRESREDLDRRGDDLIAFVGGNGE